MGRVDDGESVPWREHSLRDLKGREITVESAMAPIMWNGEPSRLLVSRDTTRHKLIERQLREAKEEAEQANVAKSRFLAAASHDLRQPIQALGLLNAAMAYEADTDGLKEITANMGHAIDAMRSVLDGLLDISRLEAGVVKPEIGIFPIAPLLDRIRGELAYEAEAKGLQLRVLPSSACVRSDKDLLDRIIQNFVSNAVRYTTSGRILIGCRRRRTRLELQVLDTGPGIDPEQQERIFEEFYQLANSARDRSKGLGLGLAIVKRLARLLDHPIEVRSVPGRGTLFSVSLPIESNAVAQVDQDDPLSLIELHDKKILVLDDDAAVVDATRTLLARWGAEVMEAYTADDAVEIATKPGRCPDLIIVDYLLNDGVTGTDVIRVLDEELGYAIPRIVISGEISARILNEVRNAGSRLLHKPVNPAKLRSLINHMLSAEI
jgi:signal transduction histidine kinase